MVPRFQIVTSIVRSIATRTLTVPLGAVFLLCAAPIAAIPSASLRCESPGRVLVDLIRPADS